MYSFKNDYCEGGHPRILQALLETNMQQEEGYGLDRHSLNAQAILRELVGDSHAGVHFLSGGTQTNLTAICAFLRPHEACIAAKTGHIATHESGAIEATGHKVLTVETDDGKLTPELIAPVLTEHHFEHMVKPAMVYISCPTELGTVYTRAELERLYAFCQEKNLILYADGARLGSALATEEAGLTLHAMYEFTDAFFIGGTKGGALLGEALILKNADLKEEIRYLIKQRGALLSKGRILGIQLETLFEDGLYVELAAHANAMAQKMAKGLKKAGCDFFIHSPTNQIFPIFPNAVIDTLLTKFGFYTWAAVDETHSAVRLITSWATPERSVDAFLGAYKEAMATHQETLHA